MILLLPPSAKGEAPNFDTEVRMISFELLAGPMVQITIDLRMLIDPAQVFPFLAGDMFLPLLTPVPEIGAEVRPDTPSSEKSRLCDQLRHGQHIF